MLCLNEVGVMLLLVHTGAVSFSEQMVCGPPHFPGGMGGLRPRSIFGFVCVIPIHPLSSHVLYIYTTNHTRVHCHRQGVHSLASESQKQTTAAASGLFMGPLATPIYKKAATPGSAFLKCYESSIGRTCRGGGSRSPRLFVSVAIRIPPRH